MHFMHVMHNGGRARAEEINTKGTKYTKADRNGRERIFHLSWCPSCSLCFNPSGMQLREPLFLGTRVLRNSFARNSLQRFITPRVMHFMHNMHNRGRNLRRNAY